MIFTASCACIELGEGRAMEDNLKRLGRISTKEMPGPSKFVKPYTIAYELVGFAKMRAFQGTRQIQKLDFMWL